MAVRQAFLRQHWYFHVIKVSERTQVGLLIKWSRPLRNTGVGRGTPVGKKLQPVEALAKSRVGMWNDSRRQLEITTTTM